ncbi:DEAD/DEAH box helicase [Lactobacillus sp. CC-MHH1034]|uniref:DEAD/DEAH box helicase n=1 Tax=Agrilactobacillus fermenti TaxID=2586909 RepID=UPI001E3E08FE|nr:DEAD/DEAH box helicase [Agrilactobacillus fermenti]MCD2256771.1 DEAD/DEAH box helicase [Agrilactobacillus fermenti]
MAATFKQFNFSPQMIQALDKIGFTTPTSVQEKLLPAVLSGRDVVGQSQTGSGKTHTFLIPILEKIDVNSQKVQAVVTAPSRELATQLYQAFEQLVATYGSDIMVHNYVGGTDKARQIEKLQHHQPQIVIGTPGRILDLITANALQVQTAKTFVVDEADMTLDLGFLPDVDKIAGKMPKELQILVFSATIPPKLQPFLRKYLHNPLFEQIQPKTLIPETIHNYLYFTQGRDKNALLYRLLTMGEPYLVLIFANTKEKVDEIYDFLKHNGLNVAKVHGGIQARERKRVMKAVVNLQYQYVVATDLAARGIDIPGVSHVVNYELPSDLEFFIHRVGRTGRNGMSGVAYTLYGPDETRGVDALEKMGISFESVRLKDGVLVPAKDRHQRENRHAKGNELEPSLKGYVKKAKRKRKPGYKRKIKAAIQEDARQKRKIEQRRLKRKKRKG